MPTRRGVARSAGICFDSASLGFISVAPAVGLELAAEWRAREDGMEGCGRVAGSVTECCRVGTGKKPAWPRTRQRKDARHDLRRAR